MFDVSATPTPETRSLQYHIPIKGVVPKTQVIYIVRLLKPTSTVQSGKAIVTRIMLPVEYILPVDLFCSKLHAWYMYILHVLILL